MAIDTKAKRAVALLDQPLLFPDGVITTGLDWANMLSEYFQVLVISTNHVVSARPYLLCGFFNNPGDLFINYVDITPYLRDEGVAAASRRGRQQVTQRFTTGTGTFILDNRAMTFEALNPSSPYTGYLLVDRPVQYGLEVPWLPGLLADGGFAKGITGWTVVNATLAWQAAIFGNISGKLQATSTGTSAVTINSDMAQIDTSHLSWFAAGSVRIGRSGSSVPPTCTLAIKYYADQAATVLLGTYSTSVQGTDTWASDSFDHTDSALLLGTPEMGPAWVAALGAWGISTNKGYIVTSAGAKNFAVVDALRADVDIAVTLSTVASEAGIIFHYQDANNFWAWVADPTNTRYRLRKCVAGAFTDVNIAGAPVNGDVLLVRTRGSVIRCYVNGVLKQTTTDAAFATLTKHGIGTTVNTTAGRWDAFSITQPQVRVSITDPSIPPVGTNYMRLVVSIPTPLVAGEVDEVQAAALDMVPAVAMAGLDPQFTGYADGWDCKWDIGDNLCTLSASDALKALALAGLNTTLYGTYLRTLAPTKWYRLGETVLSQYNIFGLALKDQVTGAFDASVAKSSSAGAPYRNRGPLAGVAGCSPVDPDLGFSLVGPSSQDGGAVDLGQNFSPNAQKWSYCMWFRSTDGIVPQVADGRTGTGDAFPLLALGYPFVSGGAGWSNTSLWINHFGQVSAMAWDSYYTNASRKGSGQASLWGTTASTSNGGINTVVDTLWHRAWVTYDGSNNTLKVYVDGLLDHTEAQFSGATGFTFAIQTGGPAIYRRLGMYYTAGAELLNAGYPPKFEVDEVMLFNGTAVDSTTIATDYLKGKLTYPAQRSDERVNAVLDNVPWPTTRRSVSTNQGVTVTAQAAAISHGNPVTYLQQVEDSEAGLFFVNAAGNVVWVTHADLVDAAQAYTSPQFVFGGGVGEIPFEDVITSNNDRLVYNAAQAAIEGGSPQVSTGGDKTRWPRMFVKQGLLLPANDDALEMAEWWAAVLAGETTSFDGLVINPLVSETALQAAQGIDIGTAIEVRIRPPGITPGTYFSVVAQVQAVNVNTWRKRIRITYSLSSLYTQRWYQFGDGFSTYAMAL